MRRHHAADAALTVALTTALLGLTGCSDASSTSDEPTASASAAQSSDVSTGSSSDSASASPGGSSPSEDPRATAAPSGSPEAARSVRPTGVPANLPRSRIQAANLHNAYLGRNAADTAEEQAAVTAWLSYWQGAADTYYLYRPTELFESVARGRARQTVEGYLASLKRRHWRVMGWSVQNVTAVKVTGDRATLRDCTESFTFQVDNESEPISRVTPYFDTTGTLERTGGKWTVVDYRDRAMERSCLR